MGRTKEACDKFAESQELDPHIGTLLNLAHCSEDLGLLLEAERYWRAAESLARQSGDERDQEARDRRAELEARIPTLTVVLAAAAPAATTVELVPAAGGSSVVLAANELGNPRRTNPGSYRLVVKAPGRPDRSYAVRLTEGAAASLEVDAAPGPEEPSTGAQAEADAESAVSGWTVAGGVALGLGLVGLGVGAAFAGVASSKNAESNETDDSGFAPCDDDGYCNEDGLALRSAAIDAATASTALFVVGGVLAAGGLAMLIFAPEEEAEGGAVAELRWSVTPGGLVLGGRF